MLSLLADLQGKENSGTTGPVRLLLDSSYKQCENRAYDDALDIVAEASKLAKKSKDSVAIANCINLKGYIYYKQGKYGESIRCFEPAVAMLRNLDAPSELAAALVNMGITYKELAQYDKALGYLFEAVKYYDKADEPKRLSSAYNTIGNILRIEKNYESALKYHFMALALRRKIVYNKGIGGSLHNIGMTYMEMKLYDSALLYFNDALLIKQKQSDLEALTSTYSQMGEIHERTGSYAKAAAFYNEALETATKAGNRADMALSMLQLGRLSGLMHQLRKSEQLLLNSLALSYEADVPDIRLECFDALKNLYKRTGNHKRSLDYAERYIVLHDTLLGIDKQKALIQLEMKYNVELVRGEYEDYRISAVREHDAMEAQRAQDKRYNRNLVIWVITLIIIVVLLFFLLRNRNRYAKKLDMLMRELHHRVTNNLQVLSSIFYLQLTHIPKGDAHDTIRSNNDRVTAMMLIHKDLYKRDNITKVNINDYINSLVQNLLAVHRAAGNVNVHYNIKPAIELEVDKAILVGLLVNELATNALKYAFGPQAAHPMLEVTFDNDRDGAYHLSVCDNGPGMPEEVHDRSMGLKLADSLVKQLKGTMKRTYADGLCYEISFR